MPNDRGFRIAPIPDPMRRIMRGRSWRDDPRCPPFDGLVLVSIRHVDFDDSERDGSLVVAAEVGTEVRSIFETLFERRFPIRRVEPIDVFDADDDASMAADNTSAFNFRTIAGSNTLSHHALGLAVDINPAENPMILGGVVHPPAAVPYVDRNVPRKGMILEGGPVVVAFEAAGWHWGGRWTDLPDYHHFSRRPRGS